MSEKFFCPNCGAALEQGVKFCASCGNQLQTAQTAQPAQPAQPAQTTQAVTVQVGMPQQPVYAHQQASTYSRGLALLLCWFVGFFGSHRFYIGSVGMGVLYLLTGGIFGIGVFIDFFVILFGSMRDGQGRLLVNW